MKVSVAEARNKLTQLIQAAEKGECVTICRHGKPVVDIVRTNTEERIAPKFGTGKGRVKVLDSRAFEPMTDEEFESFLQGRY